MTNQGWGIGISSDFFLTWTFNQDNIGHLVELMLAYSLETRALVFGSLQVYIGIAKLPENIRVTIFD